MTRPVPILFLLLLLLLSACGAKASLPPARVYQESQQVKPGSHRLVFHLDGRGELSEYLSRECARDPQLNELGVPVLLNLFRQAYPELYQPVQPGVPLCNLETNFKYCNGIELLADVDIYGDQTVVLHGWVLYHVRLRLEAEHPNFFRSAKTQRDRGDFSLPRHYYVGELVDTVRRGLPILGEIASDYRKYVTRSDQEIEIELTLEVAPEKAAAKVGHRQIRDSADLSGGFLLSSLPNLPFFLTLTVSALYSGGKTFWEVLKEGKDFEICKRDLRLDEVEFSYGDSIVRNFSHILKSSNETPQPIFVREIKIRLRQKEQQANGSWLMSLHHPLNFAHARVDPFS